MLQEKIITAANDVTRLQKVRARLEQLNQEIVDLEGKIGFLVQKVDEESKDIEALKKTGVKSLFYKILGNKEAQLEKERQEYLQANLEYDEAQKSLELLKYERNILESKVHQLPAAEKNYEALLQERENEILQSDPVLKRTIENIDFQIDQRRKVIFEMQEAIQVGTDAIKLLDMVVGKLNQAVSWGQWDAYGRRGRMPGHFKYRYIDQAKDLAYKANISLRQFEQELRDIYGPKKFNLSVKFDAFASFTEVFFDNLITDWIVQQKIHNTLSGVRSVRDRVYRLVSSLQVDIPKRQQEMEALAAERKRTIVGAD